MANIFVSYAHKDYDVVNQIMIDLHQFGLDYWMDRKDLQGGDRWSAEIERSIKSAKKILLFVSSASMGSSYVLKEVLMAMRLKKQIVILRLEDSIIHPDLEEELSQIQWIDHGVYEWKTRLAMALKNTAPDELSQPKALRFLIEMGLGFLLPIFGCIAISVAGISKYFLESGWLPSAEQIITTTIVFLFLLLMGFIVFMVGLDRVGTAAIGRVSNIDWIAAAKTAWRFLANTFSEREEFLHQFQRLWVALKSLGTKSIWNDPEFKERGKAALAGIIPGLGLWLRGRKWLGFLFLIFILLGYSELFPGILLHITSIVLSAVLDRPGRLVTDTIQ